MSSFDRVRAELERVRAALAAGSRRLVEARDASASGPTRAAVLIALFDAGAGALDVHVWLIRRPDGLRAHAGQVALPGGKRNPGDADAAATALREAQEEIGLAPDLVDVLGWADDLETSTGYVITPVVGWIRGAFAPRPNPPEVVRAFHAPLSMFEGEGVFGIVPYEPLRHVARAYRVDDEIVWGATAHILHAFALRLAATSC